MSKELVAHAKRMAEDHRYDLQPAARLIIKECATALTAAERERDDAASSAEAARTNFHTMQGAANELRIRLAAADAEIERLTRERDEARQVVRDIYWMALRYADGRMTYAVGMCNHAVRKGYEGGWLPVKSDGGDTITPQYARDGMSDEWKNRAALSESSNAG